MTKARVVLLRDTPVSLIILREATSRDPVGTRFRLQTVAPLVVDGNVVVPRGTLAWGEIVSSEPSGRLGRGGKVGIRLLFIELGDRHIPIDGDSSVQARDKRREATIAAAGMGSLAPLGLMMRGSTARVKAGEMLTGFVSEDAVFDDVPPGAGSQ